MPRITIVRHKTQPANDRGRTNLFSLFVWYNVHAAWRRRWGELLIVQVLDNFGKIQAGSVRKSAEFVARQHLKARPTPSEQNLSKSHHVIRARCVKSLKGGFSVHDFMYENK